MHLSTDHQERSRNNENSLKIHLTHLQTLMLLFFLSSKAHRTQLPLAPRSPLYLFQSRHFSYSLPPKTSGYFGIGSFLLSRKPLAPPQPLIAEPPLLLRQMTHQRIGKVQVHTVKGKGP